MPVNERCYLTSMFNVYLLLLICSMCIRVQTWEHAWLESLPHPYQACVPKRGSSWSMQEKNVLCQIYIRNEVMINQQRAGQWMTHGHLMNTMHKMNTMNTMKIYFKCRYAPCTWSPVAGFNYVWQSTPMPACCPPEVACSKWCYSIIIKKRFNLKHVLLVWLIIVLQKCWT